MSKFKETYYIENIESRETEIDKTEKLFTEIKKQTNWALIKAYKKRERSFLRRKGKVFGCFFKKSIKFLIDGDGSIKELWENLE